MREAPGGHLPAGATGPTASGSRSRGPSKACASSRPASRHLSSILRLHVLFFAHHPPAPSSTCRAPSWERAFSDHRRPHGGLRPHRTWGEWGQPWRRRSFSSRAPSSRGWASRRPRPRSLCRRWRLRRAVDPAHLRRDRAIPGAAARLALRGGPSGPRDPLHPAGPPRSATNRSPSSILFVSRTGDLLGAEPPRPWLSLLLPGARRGGRPSLSWAGPGPPGEGAGSGLTFPAIPGRLPTCCCR